MPNYLVECDIPGAGQLMPLELQSIAQQCTLALMGLEAQIQWLYSIITADRLICLYVAEDETAVREHARCSGLPIERISEVSATIGPTLDMTASAFTRIDGLNMTLIVQPLDCDL